MGKEKDGSEDEIIELFCALRIPKVDLLKQRLGNVSHRELIFVHAKPSLDLVARIGFRNARVLGKLYIKLASV